MGKTGILAMTAVLLAGAAVIAAITPVGHRIFWPFLLLLVPVGIAIVTRKR